MTNDSPLKAIVVVTLTALLCSILVTTSVIQLQPIQHAYKDLERNRFLVEVSGLTNNAAALSDRDVIGLFQKLDARIINLDTGAFDFVHNPDTFDSSEAAADLALSVAIPANLDIAKLNRRSRFITIFLVKDDSELKRMVLPIYGQGMWSKLYGFIALESDLNTIADVTFYEQAETAGIGDQILNPDWHALWRGRRLYDDAGTVRFDISHVRVNPSSPNDRFHVDAISGATVTTDAVSNMVNYWFGPHGYGPFFESYRRLDYR